jgi:dTDP-L-rhamnose 4-epimerase
MSKLKVLVTGGAGFIGLTLSRHLLNGNHEVAIFDNLSAQIHGAIPTIDVSPLLRRGVKVVRGDVRNSREVGEAVGSADVVVHLAAETGTAQSMYEIARYNSVNSQGTAEVLDWLLNHSHRVSKLILASSRSIYGEGSYRCAMCGVVQPAARTNDGLAKHQWEPRCPSCDGEIKAIPTPESARPQPASIYAATKVAQEDLVRVACSAAGIPFTILRFQNVYGAGQSLANPYTGIL